MPKSRKGKVKINTETLERNIDLIKRSSAYKDPENRDYVESLEKRIDKIKADADFLNLDYVKDIVKKLKSVLLDIRLKLVDEDDSEKRRVLKCDQAAYERVLSWFSRDINTELASINDRAEDILEKDF